jgi:hypothetical protein
LATKNFRSISEAMTAVLIVRMLKPLNCAAARKRHEVIALKISSTLDAKQLGRPKKNLQIEYPDDGPRPDLN